MNPSDHFTGECIYILYTVPCLGFSFVDMDGDDVCYGIGRGASFSCKHTVRQNQWYHKAG